jgi:hypothetical protein
MRYGHGANGMSDTTTARETNRSEVLSFYSIERLPEIEIQYPLPKER